MSTPKMLVVTLDKTKAVLGAVTRTVAGAPSVASLIGEELLVRTGAGPEILRVPAAELKVEEVDERPNVHADPRAHLCDGGMIVAPVNKISSVTVSAGQVTVTVQGAAVAADKTVLVVVDPGASGAPLTFVGKTALNTAATVVPAGGVPAGAHLVLASVDGYTSQLGVKTFA